MDASSYRVLRWKIVGLALCFSLIPLFVLGFSIYYQFDVSYTAKIMQNLRAMAENRRDAIDLFLDERISQINTLAYTHSMDQLKEEGYLDKLFSLIQARSKSFVDLGVIDQNGDHVVYVGPYQLKGVNYANEEWFEAAMLRGVFISDVFMGFRKFPHFIIAVSRREGNKTWILRATIDTSIFDSMVRAAQVGKRGDAFVLNRYNVLQTSPRFGNDSLGKTIVPEYTSYPGTRAEEMSIEGETFLVASTWLRNKDWLLVVKEDPGEELLPIFRARNLLIGVVLGGVLLIVLGTVFIARAMIAQLVRADRERAALDSGLIQSSKMAALGKLAAGIAHEVNNPLAVIKEKAGWIRDLLSEEDIANSQNLKEFEDSVKKIEHHVERAKKVTHRLLGFARRMEPIDETVDVNRVVQETMGFLEHEARYRNIEIRTELLEDLPQTSSDSAQLQQVFLNILENAIDAAGKDGKIVVRTNYSPRDREITVNISDNGPGIRKEMLGRIFDPFFTTKPTGEGTGLGLSICYSIIEKLGGKITVSSDEGKGTAFSVHVPVR
jgi:two-component system, NtrC family, sensor kinase